MSFTTLFLWVQPHLYCFYSERQLRVCSRAFSHPGSTARNPVSVSVCAGCPCVQTGRQWVEMASFDKAMKLTCGGWLIAGSMVESMSLGSREFPPWPGRLPNPDPALPALPHSTAQNGQATQSLQGWTLPSTHKSCCEAFPGWPVWGWTEKSRYSTKRLAEFWMQCCGLELQEGEPHLFPMYISTYIWTVHTVTALHTLSRVYASSKPGPATHSHRNDITLNIIGF